MTMHAKLSQAQETESGAFLFSGPADPTSDELVTRSSADSRSAYGESRRPNWPTILLILLLHGILLVGLARFEIVVSKKKAPTLTIIDVTELAPPPIETTPRRDEVPVEAANQLTAPSAIVPPVVFPTPPVVAAPTPVTPEPVLAPLPAGPVVVGDLEEKMIEGSPPRYPIESRRKNEQGIVQLRILIGIDGKAAQVWIAQSSGFERLDQAALQAAKSWRWQPVMRNGQPIEVRGIMSIPFVLKP